MIQTIGGILYDFWNLYAGGGLPRGDSTGFISLDPFFTVRRGEWTLVTGIPRHGKSSFVDNVIVNLADKHDWRWLIHSPENQPIARHAGQLAEIYIGRSFRVGPGERMSTEDFHYAAGFLDTQVQFYDSKQKHAGVEDILEAALQANVNGIVMDPWNRLYHKRGPNVSETEYIGNMLGKISDFVRENPVHVFLVAHPQKMMRQKSLDGNSSEAATYPIPTPYDVSGSAHWVNMSDNCICVWRDLSQPNSETEIHVQKVRFREVGQIGMCRLMYDPTNGQFVDKFQRPRRFDVDVYNDEMQLKIERHEEQLAKAQLELESVSLKSSL